MQTSFKLDNDHNSNIVEETRTKKLEYRHEIEYQVNCILKRAYRIYEMSGYRDASYYMSDEDINKMCEAMDQAENEIRNAFKLRKKGYDVFALPEITGFQKEGENREAQ